MSTQLDESFFEICPRVQLVIHPTAYRYIPEALELLIRKQLAHLLVTGNSNEEIYDRLLPLRLLEDKITAAVTIMKGCDIHCSYCIEPYTRGGRINRSYDGIMAEIADIREKDIRRLHFLDILWIYGKANATEQQRTLTNSYPTLPNQALNNV